MEVIIRASSWPDFFDCPKRWASKNLDGKRSYSSPEALLGTAVHAGTAVYDRERATGHPISASEAALAVVDSIEQGKGDVAWSAGDSILAIRAEAISTHNRYCAEVDSQEPWDTVEYQLPPVTLQFDGIRVKLTGALDRRRIRHGRARVGDVKTGRGFKAGSYVSQIGTYCVLSTNENGLPADGQLDHATQSALTVHQVPTAAAAMLGTSEQPGLIETAATMIKTGLLYGNPKSMLCTRKFCPAFSNCSFRGGIES